MSYMMATILLTITLSIFAGICIALIAWGIRSRRRTRF